jgi:hypothetical protein
MEKREQLLLAAKIYQNKDYFEFHSDNDIKLDAVDIEIIDFLDDEFEHQNANRVNKIVFNDKEVTLSNSNISVIIPDFLYTYIQMKEAESTNKLHIVLNNALPKDLMEAFQIAYNRIKYEETHQEKSPNEFEEKLIQEMKPFDNL